MKYPNNCLLPSSIIARQISFQYPGASVMSSDLSSGALSFAVAYFDEIVGFTITLEQRTWSLDQIMREVVGPKILPFVNGIIEGAT